MNTFFFNDVQYPEGLFGGKDLFNPIIYSTEEREVGVGENGKPLYQKTIKSGLIPADTITSEILTNIDECHVVDIKTYNSDNTIAFIPNSISMYNYQGVGTTYGYVYFNVTNHSVMFVNQSRGNSAYIEATIQYTKTTDVAGSGSYTTLGVPAVHYTTEEQVIGTWTDGKPLYQKTLKSNSGIAQNSWVIIINDSNIRIKNYYGYIYYSANLEDGTKYPLDWTRVANSAYSCTECNGGDLEVLQNVGTSYGYDITIQYTKTS